MRFIPSEFRSLALSFSPLPLSYPLSRSTCGRGCASEQCIHTYAASLCAYTYTRLHTYTYNSLTFPLPPPLSLSLCISLFLHTFVPLPPQEQRIMLFRFTYMRPTIPGSRYGRCTIPAIPCDILASLHEFFLPAHVYLIR